MAARRNYGGGTNRSTGARSTAKTPAQKNAYIYRNMVGSAPQAMVDKIVAKRTKAANYKGPKPPRRGTGGRR